MKENEDKNLGWDDIDKACKSIYPNQEPLHYATIIKYKFGGHDPLDGISIYDGGDYYHFVTYGFSEIYEKENDNKDVSGFGFELTFKLRKNNNIDEEELKNFCGILQHNARYVFEKKEIIKPYEYIYTGQTEGIDKNGKSSIVAFVTIEDKLLKTINTVNGKLQFIELIGITNEELQQILTKEKPREQVINEIIEKYGDITDYNRSSNIKNEQTINVIEDSEKNIQNINNSNTNISNIITLLTSFNKINYVMLFMSILCIPLGLLLLIFAFTHDFSGFLFILAPFIEIVGITFLLLFYNNNKTHKKNTFLINKNEVQEDLKIQYIELKFLPLYFVITNNYLLSNYFYLNIINIKDIFWIYTTHNFINICLVDGKKISLPNAHYMYKGEDAYAEIINNLYNELIAVNPNILIGNNKENYKTYNDYLYQKKNHINYYDNKK